MSHPQGVSPQQDVWHAVIQDDFGHVDTLTACGRPVASLPSQLSAGAGSEMPCEGCFTVIDAMRASRGLR